MVITSTRNKMHFNLKPDLLRLFPTYSNSFISIIDPDVVSLPRNGGLRMAPGRDTLHDSRLSCCHHHITGRLTEIISQNWEKKEKVRRQMVNGLSFSAFLLYLSTQCTLSKTSNSPIRTTLWSPKCFLYNTHTPVNACIGEQLGVQYVTHRYLACRS